MAYPRRPPMETKETWRQYVAHLKKHVPAAYANLAPGASKETIAQLETKLGVVLPESVKVVWRLNDGQKETMILGKPLTTPSIPSLSFLSTAAGGIDLGELGKNAAEG